METDERLYFLIGVDIAPEVEDEFNTWYDEVHMPETVACPGFRSGRRFGNEGPDASPKYFALYEVENTDILTSPAVKALGGFGKFAPSVSNVRRTFLRSRTPLIEA